MTDELIYSILGRLAIAAIAMAQPLLIYIAIRILKRVDDLNVKVNVTNGKVGRLETWQVQHEKLDDERTNQLNLHIDRLARLTRPIV